MSQEKWDGKSIEELLSNVPKIRDTRSKDEVLQRLIDDGVFDEKPSSETKQLKKNNKWIPPFISIAAVALLAIMVPSLLDQMNNKEQTEVARQSEDSEEVSILENPDNNMIIMATESDTVEKTAVYPEDVDGYTLFPLGLATEDASYSVPVTILIPNEKVVEDLGKQDPTGVELYNYYAPLVDETAIGFAEFHPYSGEVSEKGNQVIQKLPSNHSYDMSPAMTQIYDATLIDTFKNYDEVTFTSETGSPVIFGEEGVERKPLSINDNTNYSYSLHVQPNGSEFLAPNNRENFATVEEAIMAMKVENNDIYQSVILSNVDYTVSENKNTVIVTFSSELDIDSYDSTAVMRMIEGILLTAAEFNMQVQFENFVQNEWGGFDFTKPLPIPVGPNKLPSSVIQEK